MSRFTPPPDLPPDARRTFRFHLTYALLDAACGGILMNAPVIALREIHAQDWQLPLRDWCAGFGMLASLYLGSWMAPRRKMPFVVIPGVMAGISAMAMAGALSLGSSFWFLLFLGIGGMLEIVTRAPIAAILRENYPVAHRGHVTATVRQWCSLIFLIVFMLAATILQYAGENVRTVASIEIIVAAVLGLSGFACFRKIPIRNDQTIRTDFHLEILKNVREIAGVVIRDTRYRRFLIGCALEVFFMMLYLPLVPALLSKTLKFDYVWCALLLHGIPTLAAFITTGWIGQWFDRTNPWISWFTVRFAFGLDALLLAATPVAAYYISPLVWVLPIVARLARGAVQGGWWILWWQIGITHFAPPGEDTSRYAGIMVFLNGIVKIAATAVGMTLMSPAFQCRTETLLWIGGLGIIASGAYSLLQAFRERKEHRPQTFAEFEAEFDAKTQPTAPSPSARGPK